MELQVKIEKGKVTDNALRLRDFITSQDDGDYIISIVKVNPLVTPRDYQKAYFDKVDKCVLSTGNDRYTIHNSFKQHSNITTTSNLSILEWRNLLMNFTIWAYSNFDCIV